MNRLQYEKSPYLLQHAENPVHWYPWCGEAFAAAEREDKPIFLSIGYSTCHWCHVMAHESFEDEEVAQLLNARFIPVKVDREERPDVDGIYMRVCEAYTGSGGWPLTVLMTSGQTPFFAGTYYPKAALMNLLRLALAMWDTDRARLLQSGHELIAALRDRPSGRREATPALAEEAAAYFRKAFDREYGGFGRAPKFPSAHNLMFLLAWSVFAKDGEARAMAEKTLTQFYRGGVFDHIGGGFSRYSTDRQLLVPHFEKMLYDNALLILAYSMAWGLTGNALYRTVAEKTADYVLRELTSPEGGFYSAEDADSEGVEGRYYTFAPEELTRLLGGDVGALFNQYYGITPAGNFEGKSIPNLLHTDAFTDVFEQYLPSVREYRRERAALHLDDKILTAWNGLMTGALSALYRATGTEKYLLAAERAAFFMHEVLMPEGMPRVGWRDGHIFGPGFLDDYAAAAFAFLSLYEATFYEPYLDLAAGLADAATEQFYDEADGGFFHAGNKNEPLILRPKETYDGAMPSGNAMMAYVLVKLGQLCGGGRFSGLADAQLRFLAAESEGSPAGHSFFLLALLLSRPAAELVCVGPGGDETAELARRVPFGTALRVLRRPQEGYPLQNGRTTYYVCRANACLPPVNSLDEALGFIRQAAR